MLQFEYNNNYRIAMSYNVTNEAEYFDYVQEQLFELQLRFIWGTKSVTDFNAFHADELRHYAEVFDPDRSKRKKLDEPLKSFRAAHFEILDGNRNIKWQSHANAEVHHQYYQWLQLLDTMTTAQEVEAEFNKARAVENKNAERLYDAKIESKLNSKISSFQKILNKSIDPAQLVADTIRQTEWMLKPQNDKNAPFELGLNPNAHLKDAFDRLKKGKRSYRKANYRQIRADVEAKFLQWLKELQPPPQEHPASPTTTLPEQIMKRLEGGLGFDKFIQELQANSLADTSTAPQESKGGTEAENELTETRETVASILDPFNDKFIGKDAFEDAINRLCRYFDGEQQIKTTPIRVRNRCWKKLGKALGEIHRDIHNLKSIDKKYLQFAKDTFDCYAEQDISNEKLAKITLYKYMN